MKQVIRGMGDSGLRLQLELLNLLCGFVFDIIVVVVVSVDSSVCCSSILFTFGFKSHSIWDGGVVRSPTQLSIGSTWKNNYTML